ncbi:MAG TPA: VTT domain-containing protein [Modestobacter sp.]|nr:VTT domain-containing protein [Modestobacter sp.]
MTTTAWLRAALLVLLVTSGAFAAWTVDLPSVAEVRTWVDGAGGVAWVALVLGLALILLTPIPRTATSVLLGVVAGFGPGLGVALAGGLLGALAAFALSRTLGRVAATRLAGSRFSRVDQFVVERGFTGVLVGRLLPVVPFVVLSYGAGLTAIRPAPYALATAVGLVPGTVVQVGIGASVGALASWATVFTLGPLTVVVLAWLGALAWRRRQTGADTLPAG